MLVALALVSLLAGGPAFAVCMDPVVVNGGFETPVVVSATGPGWDEYEAPASFTGWDVSAGAVDLVDSTVWDPASGNQSIDLNGTGGGSQAGTIEQDLSTVAGNLYRVDFDMSGHKNVTGTLTMVVRATGNAAQNYSFLQVANAGSAMNWAPREFYFRATGPVTTLEFESLIPTDTGPLIDNVGVTCLCESPTVVDPGFESPVVTSATGPGYDEYIAPAGFGGWTVTEGAIDLVDSTVWDPASGNQSLDLNGTSGGDASGTIAQTLTTVVGTKYVVRFDMSGHRNITRQQRMYVRATGGPEELFTFYQVANPGTAMGWEEREYFFTATSTSTVLEFESLIPTDSGPVIDDVRVFCTCLDPQIVGGGFESPVVVSATGPGYDEYISPATFSGWTVTEGAIDLVDSTVWMPNSGNQSLDLNGTTGGDASGTIEQSFDTIAGAEYQVDFAMSGHKNVTGPLAMEVRAGNGIPQTFTFHQVANDGSSMGWVDEQFIFTATASSTVIEFKSLVPTDSGPVIDDVSVSCSNCNPPTPVPLLPGVAYAVLAGAMLCMGWARLRQR